MRNSCPSGACGLTILVYVDMPHSRKKKPKDIQIVKLKKFGGKTLLINCEAPQKQILVWTVGQGNMKHLWTSIMNIFK